MLVLFIPRFSDKFGRKKITQISSIICFILYTVLISVKSLSVSMVVILLYGMTMPLQFTIGFIYLLELMPSNYQTIVTTSQNIASTLTVISCALYFAFISKDWFYFVLIGYALQFIQMITLWLLPESPK